MTRNALGSEFGSAARLSKSLGSVWDCPWGHALKRSPGINRKSRVLYSGPGFLSCATLPSLSKKHTNGLINKSIKSGECVQYARLILVNIRYMKRFQILTNEDKSRDFTRSQLSIDK